MIALERKFPQQLGFRLERARRALNDGKLDLAEDRLKQLLADNRDYTAARVVLAKLLIDRGDEGERIRQMMTAQGDLVSPEERMAYLYRHGKDLISFGRYKEVDKVLTFCASEAKKVKLIHAEFECSQLMILSHLWRGTLALDQPIIKTYLSLSKTGGLDRRSRLYFTAVRLYILSQLALDQGDVEGMESLLKQLEELAKEVALEEVIELVRYLKIRGI